MLGYILLLAWITIWTFALKSKTIYVESMLLSEDFSKRYAIIASLGVVLLTGLRHWTVGPDSDAYASYITNLHNGIYLNGYDRFEKGFEYFSKVVARYTGNYTIYFMIIALIIMIGYGVLLYKATNSYFWGIFLYITIGPFIFQITGLRQAMAMAMCAFSVKFVKEKKLIPYLLLVWLATQFHASAWVFLPLYFIGRIKPSIKTIVLFSIGVFAAIYANEWIMNTANTLLGYDKGYEDASGGYINIILYLGVIAISVFTQYWSMFTEEGITEYDLLSDHKKYNVVALNMSIIAFITYILRYWFRMAERGSKYYMIGIVILLANYIESIEDEKTRRLVKFAVVFLALGLFFYRQTRESSQYIYYFFWQFPGWHWQVII